MTQFADRPNTIPWPPILFIGAIIMANLLSWLAPLALPISGALVQGGGVGLVTGGFVLMGWSFLTFRRARTTILPHQRSDALITTGPFTWSRNPIYLSEVLILSGLGLMNGWLWYLLLTPVFALAVTRLAIVREEAHMLARFGAEWEAYSATVRRWL